MRNTVYRTVNDRKGTLGASQWGGALGVSTFQTPHSVWEDYARGVQRNITPEMQERFWMGHMTEKFQRELFAEKWGVRIKTDPKKGDKEKMYLSPRDHRLGCHPDGYIDSKRTDKNRDKVEAMLTELGLAPLCEKDNIRIGIECKNRDAFAYEKWGAALTDEIPYDYMTQCNAYFECLDCDVVFLLCFTNNHQLVYIVKRDEEVLEGIIASLKEWLDEVDRGVEPEAINYEEATTINGGARSGCISADDSWFELSKEWESLKEDKKAIELKIDDVKARIVTKIGDAESVIYQDSKGKEKKLLTYKRYETKTLDKDKLYSEHPELNQADYLKITTYMKLS